MHHVTSTRRKRLAAGLAAVVVLPALLGACGGDSEPDTGPGTGPDAESDAVPGPGTPSEPPPETGSSGPEASQDPSAPPELEPIDVGPEVRREARDGVRGLVAATAGALADPDAVDEARLPVDRGGSAEEQILNLAAEYAANGWSVRGQARVVALDVVERTQKPPTLVVAACLDSSDVTVVDANGDPAGLSGNQTTRSLNLVTLVRRDGAWVVRDQTFPEDPTC